LVTRPLSDDNPQGDRLRRIIHDLGDDEGSGTGV
jgi:hypothetical protein